MSHTTIDTMVKQHEFNSAWWGEPVGIVTERDLIRLIAREASVDFESTPVSRIMTPEPITRTPDDTLYQALFVLSSRGIKHLPLVDPAPP